jgi:murein DD-endopeptidase MepM/ murein hydrolase activator NlpD
MNEAARRGTVLSTRLESVEKRLTLQADKLAFTPTLAPAVGVLTAGFGPRSDPFTGEREFHPGLTSTPTEPRLRPDERRRQGRLGKGYGRSS